MKKNKKIKFLLLFLPFLLTLVTNKLEAQKDSIITEEIVKLKYFNHSNRIQYLILDNFLKTGKKKETLKNKIFQLYLDSNKTENLIAKVTTDKNGKAKSFLPPALKVLWEANPMHKFIAVTEGKEEPVAELEITKAKIQIDTISEEGVRSIKVTVMKYENSDWIPANEVEIKAGIQRHGGILSAGEEETYTSDSSGTVLIALNKNRLPGDQKGNIILMAKVEDNELFGNLLVEKTVPWGISVMPDNNFFDQRALWTTRFRTPIWLLLMAYTIVIGVWGVIFYLIMQIIKIKKLSKTYDMQNLSGI